jgi:hypothetical protein
MLSEDIDRSLWFHHAGCTGRHYLLGNAHTVRGRMLAWCPKEKCSLFISKADIEKLSSAAAAWLAGFLHGNEAEPPPGEDGPPDFESAAYARWQAQAAGFRRTGTWPPTPTTTQAKPAAAKSPRRIATRPPAMTTDFRPEDFAQRQLDAYNARDLERFVAEYTDDVQVWRLPNPAPTLVGKAALAAHYRDHRFNLPALHAELVQRMVFGNKVIDQELVSGVPGGPLQAAAVYEVTPRGIAKVWFVSGE